MESGYRLASFASTVRVACGTARRRSLGISLPVWRQIPYVLFSMRTKAASRCWINFICLCANCPEASFRCVAAPSSRFLYVGEVSVTSLPEVLLIYERSSLYSRLAASSFSSIIWRNSSSSASDYLVFSTFSCFFIKN